MDDLFAIAGRLLAHLFLGRILVRFPLGYTGAIIGTFVGFSQAPLEDISTCGVMIFLIGWAVVILITGPLGGFAGRILMFWLVSLFFSLSHVEIDGHNAKKNAQRAFSEVLRSLAIEHDINPKPETADVVFPAIPNRLPPILRYASSFAGGLIVSVALLSFLAQLAVHVSC